MNLVSPSAPPPSNDCAPRLWHVRFGSKADISQCNCHVRFTPESGPPQAPMEAPWFWVIVAQGRKRSLSDRGYAVSREQAIAQFRTQWSRDDLVCHRVAELPTPPMPAFIVRCVQCNAQIWVVSVPKTPSCKCNRPVAGCVNRYGRRHRNGGAHLE
jgi:hypothetical protein